MNDIWKSESTVFIEAFLKSNVKYLLQNNLSTKSI